MTNINGKLVYQRIREVSNIRKISLKKLAEKAGFKSPSTIYNYQYGKSTPSETSLRAIAAALNVDINYLKGYTNELKGSSYHINENKNGLLTVREAGVPYSVDKANVDMTTFDRIKILAKKHGYTLNSLNEAAGLGARSIYRWNTRRPSDESLAKVAKILGVSVEYLRTGKQSHPEQATDKAEQNVLNMFRKSTEGMNEDEKLRFQQSLSKLMDVAKDFNQGK